jgi:hypothetical protein
MNQFINRQALTGEPYEAMLEPAIRDQIEGVMRRLLELRGHL